MRKRWVRLTAVVYRRVLIVNIEPDLLKAWDREARGIPIGRPAEVNLRNNHAQYIFTW